MIKIFKCGSKFNKKALPLVVEKVVEIEPEIIKEIEPEKKEIKHEKRSYKKRKKKNIAKHDNGLFGEGFANKINLR